MLMWMSCLRPAVAGVSPAPSSNSIMEKYDKRICGLLTCCLSASSFGDLFQVNVSSCGLCAADSKCRVCSVGDSKGTFHFACLIGRVQLSSGMALFMSWPAGFPETGDWAARWPSPPRPSGVRHGRWVPLAVGKQHGIHPVRPTDCHPRSLWSCRCCLLSPATGALDPRKPWAGDRRAYKRSRSSGSWIGRILVSACATSPTCRSGSQSIGLGAPLGTPMSSLVSSFLEADLETSLLQQGPVLFSWESSAMNVA